MMASVTGLALVLMGYFPCCLTSSGRLLQRAVSGLHSKDVYVEGNKALLRPSFETLAVTLLYTVGHSKSQDQPRFKAGKIDPVAGWDELRVTPEKVERDGRKYCTHPCKQFTVNSICIPVPCCADSGAVLQKPLTPIPPSFYPLNLNTVI